MNPGHAETSEIRIIKIVKETGYHPHYSTREIVSISGRIFRISFQRHESPSACNSTPAGFEPWGTARVKRKNYKTPYIP
jgi:hypothetical protein